MAKQEGEKSLREQQVAARKKRMAELNPPIERVRVTPANDDLRRVLKHPKGAKFPAEGSAEWPLDQFTRRRIKDGSVTREDDKKNARQPAAPPATPKPPAAAAPPQTPPQAAPPAAPPQG